MRPNAMSIPERSLEPAEDRRRVVAECKCCGEEIREGDDCYYFDEFGYVCCRCCSDAFVMDVEVE